MGRYKVKEATMNSTLHPNKTHTNLNISILDWLERLKCSGCTETLKTLGDMEDVKTPRAQENRAEVKKKKNIVKRMFLQMDSNASKSHGHSYKQVKMKTHAFTSAVS